MLYSNSGRQRVKVGQLRQGEQTNDKRHKQPNGKSKYPNG